MSLEEQEDNKIIPFLMKSADTGLFFLVDGEMHEDESRG